MLVVVTSSSDPELALLKSRPGIALIVPAHLSEPGWIYEVGRGERTQIITSKGTVSAKDISGVLTRTQRAWPAELPHIHPEDREYVAAEMTAFLAGLLNELPCPVLNPPAANSWWGPPWTTEHWQRAAAVNDGAVCCNHDGRCSDSEQIVILGKRAICCGDKSSSNMSELALRLAEIAGVDLLEASFCARHQGLKQVSLRPALDEQLLKAIEERCRTAQAS